MQLLLLGTMRLIRADGTVFEDWPTRTVAELVAKLATLSGPAASREDIAALLWPTPRRRPGGTA